MAPDDVPVQGRILSLDGRPIEDARLSISLISEPLDGNLDGFLKAFRDRPTHNSWVGYRSEHMTSLSSDAFEIRGNVQTDGATATAARRHERPGNAAAHLLREF
jgi:hypothetical protein